MTFKSRKAQGMSINVLIIAVLGFVVLIIIGSLFVIKTKKFSTDLESCAAKFSQCRTDSECRDKYQGNPLSDTDCKTKEPSKPFCCITIFENSQPTKP